MTKALVVLAVIAMSTSSAAVRRSAAPAVWLAFIRLLISTLMLLPIVLLRHKRELAALGKKTLLRYALSGITLGLHFLCYFEAVKNTSMTAATVLSCSEAFFVAIGARFIFREPIRAKGWAAISFAFVGCVLVTSARGSDSPNALMGNLLGLAAAVFSAVYTLIGKSSRKTGSTTGFTFVAYGFAALTLFTATRIMAVPIGGKDTVDWLSALWMAAVCTMLGHSLLAYSLRYERASYVSAAKLLSPVFAAVLGRLFFGEIPPPSVIWGSLIIISGIYAYSRQCAPEALAAEAS